MDWMSFCINLYLNNQSSYKRNHSVIDAPDVELFSISLRTNQNVTPEHPVKTDRVFEKISEGDIIEVFIA